MLKPYGVSSLNLSIGDWSRTRKLVLSCIEEALKKGVKLLVLPEFALCGVNLRDLFLRSMSFEKSRALLLEILPFSQEMTIVVGLPIIYAQEAYNVAAILHEGKIVAYVPKVYPLQHLEEERYFSRWPHALICNIEGVPCGVHHEALPGLEGLRVFVGNLEEMHNIRRGEIIVQVCAKPYYMGNYRRSLDQLCEFSAYHGVSILRSAMHGSDDGYAVYDGASLIIEDGQVSTLGARFSFTRDAIVSTSRDGLYNCFDPSLREHAQSESFPQSEKDHSFAELELAICLALRDYLRRAKIGKICLALSGGRDSAMCAILVARMFALTHPELRPEELKEKMKDFLICAYLPSENSSKSTQRAARVLAHELGACFYEISIQGIYEQVRATVEEQTKISLTWKDGAQDLTLQNLQARTRSSIIWTIANAHNALLLVTSNLSEAAVGYTTMDGDSSGSLNPIANLPKTLVSQWLTWAMLFHRISCLQLIFNSPPSAELRPPEAKQEDESDLMPYLVLDTFLEAFLVQRLSPLECCINCWPKLKEHCKDRQQYVTFLKKFIRMSCASQWKRNRLAGGFRVLSYNLDPKDGLRWPNLQVPFLEDFPALDAWVLETL